MLDFTASKDLHVGLGLFDERLNYIATIPNRPRQKLLCYRCRYIGFCLLILSSILVVVSFDYFKQRKGASKEVGRPISEMIASEQLRSELRSLWPRENNETNDRIVKQLNFMIRLNESGKLKATKEKLIYYVPHFNYGKPPPEGQHAFISRKCPIQSCSLTLQLPDAKKADAVLLQGFQAHMLKDLLPKRNNQIWIMTGGESPPLTAAMEILDSRALTDLVNWTMIYRRDATIPYTRGKFETFPNFTRIDDYHMTGGVNYAAGKTKKVGWMVSNCNYTVNSGRGNYAKKLSKFIDVDIYGRCGKLKCHKRNQTACLQMLRKDYKFYLAFENNCCRGYMTEKFFTNALQ